MPNRIIHEKALSSHTIAQLSAGAERLFWRLTIVADDHGRFDAHPVTMKAKCFPTMVDTIKSKNVSAWRDELEAQQLVAIYSVDGREYGYFINWTKYQRGYGLASKFPDPPLNPSIPSEKSIHDLLYEQLKMSATFCGHAIKLVQRNIRAGSGYADLVILTELGRIIIELKRTKIEAGAINQLNRYRGAMKDVFSCVAIGAGVTAGFAISHAEKSDVAVITYDVDGNTSLIIKNKQLSVCEDLVVPVKRCDFTSRSYPISENRESRIENRESICEIRSAKPTARTVLPSSRAQKLADLEALELTTDLQEWAMRTHRVTIPDHVLEEFKDHWRNESKLRSDWRATFKNRIDQLVNWGQLKPPKRDAFAEFLEQQGAMV